MLKSIYLSNFKAFGGCQKIPIAPLTIIFGPNTSGKSSIIHSLLLANHACTDGSWDAHTTRIGGESVDLGGFAQYIHQHDTSRMLEYGVEFAPLENSALSSPSSDINCKPSTYTINASIGHTTAQTLNGKRPEVLEFKIKADNFRILQGNISSDGNIAISGIDFFFLNNREFILGAGSDDDEFAVVPKSFFKDLPKCNCTLNFKGLIPHPVETDSLHRDMLRSLSEDPTTFGELARSKYGASPNSPQLDGVLCQLPDDRVYKNRLVLDLFIEDFGNQLAQVFNDVQYLGPLRYMPPRHFFGPDDQDRNWRSGGGNHWNRLRNDSNLLAKTNAAIKAIKMPYRLLARELADREFPNESVWRELCLVDEQKGGVIVSHRDVGTGVSQVLPVIALALGSQKQTIAIEQPELHLHPAAQSELADIFIESALGPNRNTLILETHSEHLMLRLLRRVREATEGALPKIKPEHISVLYVEPTSSGSVVKPMPVTSDGDFDVPWPGGFFTERFQDLP